MTETAYLFEFLEASLKAAKRDGRLVLTPHEQKVADKLARALDGVMREMIEELEAVASCQQDEARSPFGGNLPPFEGFCAGLRQIGATLLPHLFGQYFKSAMLENVPVDAFPWVLDARVDAFVSYLRQLAQVHGLAFEGGPQSIGIEERRVLDRLESDLRIISSEQWNAALRPKS